MLKDQKSDHVKILVHTPAVDGYPPEEWESLWAIPLADGTFKVDNIPFYAKDLSCDDIVEAKLTEQGLIYTKNIKRSTNSTIRVIMYDLADECALRRLLMGKECSIEGTGTVGLLAVNVPGQNIEHVLKLLEAEFQANRLDFEEGAVRRR